MLLFALTPWILFNICTSTVLPMRWELSEDLFRTVGTSKIAT
jgi:hypothetical protein